MGRNIDVYSNIEFLRNRLIARDIHATTPDKYVAAQREQNAGRPCPSCNSVSGHYAVCPLINRETAEAVSFVAGEYTEGDRISARGLNVIL